MSITRSPVIVGVIREQPPAVVVTAARFAQRFEAPLICATVDTSRYTVEYRDDGTVVAMSVDPDQGDSVIEDFDPRLRATISGVLRDYPVAWSTRALAGEPARELSRLADASAAAMIVVGTREPGIRGSLHEFFSGSVAVELAHRRHYPVVVVPLNPVGIEGDLPRQRDI